MMTRLLGERIFPDYSDPQQWVEDELRSWQKRFDAWLSEHQKCRVCFQDFSQCSCDPILVVARML